MEDGLEEELEDEMEDAEKVKRSKVTFDKSEKVKVKK